MLEMKIVRKESDFSEDFKQQDAVDFLYQHLDEFGDTKKSINASIDYALSKDGGKGGFVIIAYYDGKLVGVLITNNTGMSGYIPEHILVYVAVDASLRGKGIGRKIVEKCFELCEGDVKLHVEFENPAKRLYERVGMTNKYAEMRYTKKK